MDALGNGEPASGDNVGTVVVVTGAALLAPGAVDAIGTDSAGVVVVAADGGLDHALAAGLTPHVLIGDLDSVSADGLAWADVHAEVIQSPIDKVATDTELALTYAAARRPRRVVVLAGAGDRFDHTVAAVGALGAASLDAIDSIEAWWGTDFVTIARPGRPVVLERAAPTTFSVLALHGRCQGVSITGARWQLHDAELDPLVGLGVSNQIAAPPVSVSVGAGTATVIVPGAQP